MPTLVTPHAAIESAWQGVLDKRVPDGSTFLVADGIDGKYMYPPGSLEGGILELLRRVNIVISDYDGTLAQVGSVAMTRAEQHRVNSLSSRVPLVIVTGKPLCEASLVCKSMLKVRRQVRWLVEKGAYSSRMNEDRELVSEYYLSSVTTEEWVERLAKDIRLMWIDYAEDRWGIRVIPAGGGQHKSVISLDVCQRNVPKDIVSAYCKYGDRSFYKVKDPVVLRDIFADLERYLNQWGQRFGLPFGRQAIGVDLGNSNYEISLGVDKNIAIAKFFKEEFRGSQFVPLGCGDSRNDVSLWQEVKGQGGLAVYVASAERGKLSYEVFYELAANCHLVVKGEGWAGVLFPIVGLGG